MSITFSWCFLHCSPNLQKPTWKCLHTVDFIFIFYNFIWNMKIVMKPLSEMLLPLDYITVFKHISYKHISYNIKARQTGHTQMWVIGTCFSIFIGVVRGSNRQWRNRLLNLDRKGTKGNTEYIYTSQSCKHWLPASFCASEKFLRAYCICGQLPQFLCTISGKHCSSSENVANCFGYF